MAQHDRRSQLSQKDGREGRGSRTLGEPVLHFGMLAAECPQSFSQGLAIRIKNASESTHLHVPYSIMFSRAPELAPEPLRGLDPGTRPQSHSISLQCNMFPQRAHSFRSEHYVNCTKITRICFFSSTESIPNSSPCRDLALHFLSVHAAATSCITVRTEDMCQTRI